MPDGLEESFGQDTLGEYVTMNIHAYSFFPSVVFGGDIAFGRLYEEKTWDSPNLTALMTWFAKNQSDMNDANVMFARFSRMLASGSHWLRENTPTGSKKNISAHYDLSNEMFENFLDARMQYSSAYFQNSDQTLESAQLGKIRRLINELDVNASSHVLEVGSGWGSLAIELAKEKGCRVTTITLSKEQKKFVEDKIQQASLKSLINVKLLDYRDIQAQYDAIVSVEIIEAVGKKYLPGYFKKLYESIKTGGCFVLQGITMAEHKYRQYARGADWIQTYIFPGSHIPTRKQILKLASSAGWNTKNELDLTESYARTLGIWKDRFNQKHASISSMGFDESFIRRWNYYFSYCEAGFQERHLNLKIFFFVVFPK